MALPTNTNFWNKNAVGVHLTNAVDIAQMGIPTSSCTILYLLIPTLIRCHPESQTSKAASSEFCPFSQKHRRCLGSRLGDYGRSEREFPDPVDGRWTGCGRAGAAEIAWEEARDGGARANVRIRWTGGGRAVDGLWTGGSCRNSMGGG